MVESKDKPGDDQELQAFKNNAQKDKTDKEPEGPKYPPVSMGRLLGVIPSQQVVLFWLSAVAAVLSGGIVPLFILIFGEILNSFGPDSSEDEMLEEVTKLALYSLYIGLGLFVLCYLFVMGLGTTAELIASNLRREFFNSIMHQDVAWFDANASTEFASRIAKNASSVQHGFGEKLGRALFQVGVFFSATTIALYKGVRLAGVVSATIPLILVSGYLWGKSMELMVSGNHEAYEKSGGVAEETLNAVKTVAAFNSQDRKVADFCSHLEHAKKKGIVIAAKMGAGIGLLMGVFFGIYAIAFWYGGYLIEEREDNLSTGEIYEPGDIITILFCVMFGVMSLGQIPPLLGNVLESKVAAASLFAVIDENPKNKSNGYEVSMSSSELNKIVGNFEFRNVGFTYPTRPDVPIFKNLSFKIEAHKTTAIVGETGSGKSTIMQMIEKFYSPNEGQVLVDGIDLTRIDPVALRSKIGLVSQEPVLFATSIKENLRLAKRDATDADIKAACDQAQASVFIEKLPDKYDSYVGQGGSQLSGGQKQRIAIARALLKNPTILLLDEATSALDNISEKEVQKAIAQLSRDITQIIIAHRLSTIKHADRIVVIKERHVWEEGTHEELIAQDGVYANLAAYQQTGEQSDDEEAEQEDHDQKQVAGEHEVALMLDRKGSSERKGSDSDKGDKKKEEGFFGRVWGLNKPEHWALYLGSFVALLNGTAFPLSGVLIALALDELMFYEDGDSLELTPIIISFAVVGVVTMVVYTLQYYLFGLAGENLTLRVRESVFRAILKMPIFFFDKEENRSGALVTMLETQAAAVKNASGPVLGTACQSASSLLLGVILSFIFSWRMALALLALAPFFVLGGAAETAFYQGSSEEAVANAYQESGSIVSESIGNIRTIYSFSCQEVLTGIYGQKLDIPLKQGRRNGHLKGATFGFSQFVPNVLNGVAFLIGAAFIKEDLLNFRDMTAVIFCITFGAYGGGQAAAFAPDANAAAQGCKNIFRVLDRPSEVDPFDESGAIIKDSELKGRISISDVNFKYSGRNTMVLHHFNLEVAPGQSVALVGPSGCGKSTVIQLLLRFYLPISGSIKLDGIEISKLNIHHLRTIISLVSQEPVLFDASIEDNIRYGNVNASIEDIRNAAKAANALDFIEKDSPEGFKRRVGIGGKMLSGGQKQRVAIARAIIRNPTVMLLDEATSALDNESEQKVQEALNNVSKERSTIVIAHRISTIADCDKICVVNHGRVVEEGTHDELLTNQGLYSRLVKALKQGGSTSIVL